MNRLLTAQPGPGRRQLLPDEEEPFQFVEKLAAGVDPRLAGLPWPGIRPKPGEIAIDRHWRICVAAPRSAQVVTSFADLAAVFKNSMKVRLEVVWSSSARPAEDDHLDAGKALPDGPTNQPATAVAEGRDYIHGYDPCGVLRRVYLEDQLKLRGRPLVARRAASAPVPAARVLRTGRHGRSLRPAAVYTDGHLSLISTAARRDLAQLVAGSDHDRRLPTEIPPGQVPEGTTYAPFTSRLHDLVERAERYGLEVVILYAAPYPGNDQEKKVVQEEARRFLSEFPKIRSIVLLDEGMGSMRKGTRAWVDTCTLLMQAFGEVRPDVRVVAWRYSFASSSPDRSAWNKAMQQFCQLDQRLAYTANFDSFWARRRDGQLQRAYDYCLSLKGPSEDYRHAVDYLVREARGQSRPLVHLGQDRDPLQPGGQHPAEILHAAQGRTPGRQRLQAVDRRRSPVVSQGFYPTRDRVFGWMSYTNSAGGRLAAGHGGVSAGQENLARRGATSRGDLAPFYFGLGYR